MKSYNKILFCIFTTFIFSSLTSIQEVTNESMFNTALQQNRLVLVDFYMPGCQPCMLMATILEQLSIIAQFSAVTFIKINVTQVFSLSNRFNIRAVPVIMIFNNGTLARTFIGIVSSEELKTALSSYL